MEEKENCHHWNDIQWRYELGINNRCEPGFMCYYVRSISRCASVVTNKATSLKNIVSEFEMEVFPIDSIVLFCKLCEVQVMAEKRYTVQQHIGHKKHKHI